MKLGTIEGGGTKFVVGVGDENGNIFERESFPTTTPEETMKKTIEFFKDKGVEAIGFGSFGPIDPDKTSPTYGSVTTTPKPGWSNHNVVKDLEEAFPGVPVGFDTDVNSACLGEVEFGAAKGLNSALYLTIGTGVGGGAVVEGKRRPTSDITAILYIFNHRPDIGAIIHTRLITSRNGSYEIDHSSRRYL